VRSMYLKGMKSSCLAWKMGGRVSSRLYNVKMQVAAMNNVTASTVEYWDGSSNVGGLWRIDARRGLARVACL
jgi:hypothetical protein